MKGDSSFTEFSALPSHCDSQGEVELASDVTVPLVWGTRASLTTTPRDPDALDSFSHCCQPGCHLQPCMVSSSTPPVSGGTTYAQGDEGPAHIMTMMHSETGEGSHTHRYLRDQACGPSRPKQNKPTNRKPNRHLPHGYGRGCQPYKGQGGMSLQTLPWTECRGQHGRHLETCKEPVK